MWLAKEVSDGASIHFIEHIENEARGDFIIQQNNPPPQKFYRIALWTGEVQSDKFSFTGIGSADSDLTVFCGLSFPQSSSITTVWGECGNGSIYAQKPAFY